MAVFTKMKTDFIGLDMSFQICVCLIWDGAFERLLWAAPKLLATPIILTEK